MLNAFSLLLEMQMKLSLEHTYFLKKNLFLEGSVVFREIFFLYCFSFYFNSFEEEKAWRAIPGPLDKVLRAGRWPWWALGEAGLTQS